MAERQTFLTCSASPMGRLLRGQQCVQQLGRVEEVATVIKTEPVGSGFGCPFPSNSNSFEILGCLNGWEQEPLQDTIFKSCNSYFSRHTFVDMGLSHHNSIDHSYCTNRTPIFRTPIFRTLIFRTLIFRTLIFRTLIYNLSHKSFCRSIPRASYQLEAL